MVNEKRLVESFVKLVSIDSPSFGEGNMAEHIIAKLGELGFSVILDNAGEQIYPAGISGELKSSGNVFGFLKGNTSAEPILFSSHMDTVAPAFGKKAVIEEDGTIKSNGDTVLGADDLAGVAILLEAFEVIKENGLPHGDIEVLFTVVEEVYAKGADAFDYSKVKSKKAYVLDYGEEIGTAVYAAPTILPFTITVKGKPAHAGFAPEEGVHAIDIASRCIVKTRMGRIDEETTVNIGEIKGGRATNIVPDECVLKGEIRSYRHDKALAQWEEIKSIFENEAKEKGGDIAFETETGVTAYELSLESETVNHFKAACNLAGIDFRFTKTFGGSDNNVFMKQGIEGLVLASAMHKCHTCEEYTTVNELVKGSELVLALASTEIR